MDLDDAGLTPESSSRFGCSVVGMLLQSTQNERAQTILNPQKTPFDVQQYCLKRFKKSRDQKDKMYWLAWYWASLFRQTGIAGFRQTCDDVLGGKVVEPRSPI